MRYKNVLNIYRTKVWCGVDTYVYDISREMSAQGKKVYIAVEPGNEIATRRMSEVAQVVPAKLSSAIGLGALSELKEFIVKNKIEVINCHSSFTLLLCILLKLMTNVKLVFFKHTSSKSKRDFYHSWQRKHIDACICVSKMVYDLQVNALSEAERSKFHCVYNGIGLEKFAQHKDVNKANKDFIIGYAGRMSPDKGIDILLKAFAILSKKYADVRLELAGMDENNYYDSLQKIVDDNNLQEKVSYKGLVSDMELFYKSIDLFVLPSTFKEPFGLVLCEALYCGVPVVTTNSGAQGEIIKAGYGYIAQAGDAEDLATKLEEAYLGKIFDTKKAARYVEENFSMQSCVKGIFSVYEEM